MADFFISKNWKWFSKSCWFWRYQNFGPIPWELDSKIFNEYLKMRRWHTYAWAFPSQNHQMCITFYTAHFDIYKWGYLFDFVSTHAILTPVKSIFWSVFHEKPFFLCRSLWQHWYQKMWNFFAHLLIYVKSLPEDAHPLKRPRKS